LPKRSQAYAATLCWGARFAIDSSNQAKADAVCRRYVANGAYQAWARDFGQICPAPDFEGARTFWARRIADWVTRFGLATHQLGRCHGGRRRAAGDGSLARPDLARPTKLKAAAGRQNGRLW